MGEYDLYCTEYCGSSHSQMIGKVIVYDEEDFEYEIAGRPSVQDRRHRGARSPSGEAGFAFYNRCSQCHTLDGSDGTGPSWKGLWERTERRTVFTDGTTLASGGRGQAYETGPEDYLTSRS